MTQGYASIFSKTTPLQKDFKVMFITTYKEVNQLQCSCISLPTTTVPVVTPYMYIVWQTKCEFVTCISHVLRVFTIPHVHAYQNHVQQCMHTPVF